MALVDVNADALHSATDQLAFGGRKAIAIRCNVADENEVAAMVQQTVSSFGGLDSVRRQLFFRACCLTKKCYRSGSCRFNDWKPQRFGFEFARESRRDEGKWKGCFWLSTFPRTAGAVGMWESQRDFQERWEGWKT